MTAVVSRLAVKPKNDDGPSFPAQLDLSSEADPSVHPSAAAAREQFKASEAAMRDVTKEKWTFFQNAKRSHEQAVAALEQAAAAQASIESSIVVDLKLMLTQHCKNNRRLMPDAAYHDRCKIAHPEVTQKAFLRMKKGLSPSTLATEWHKKSFNTWIDEALSDLRRHPR